MIHRKHQSSRRRGAAVVEFAMLSPLLLTFLLGIWEVGRMVDCYQVVNNAAREGARKAATGSIVDPTSGVTTNVYATDVTNASTYYLAREGYSTANVSVTFSNLTQTSKTDPYQATQGDKIQVQVSIPYADVRWGVTSPFATPLTNIQATVIWTSVANGAFTVNQTIPAGN
jgi:Flp pilus assembly protein TadG